MWEFIVHWSLCSILLYIDLPLWFMYGIFYSRWCR